VEPDATVAAVDAEALEREALSAIESAPTTEELDDVRVRYLGRKSDLKQALRGVRDRETGMALNAVRERLEEAVHERQATLDAADLERVLAAESVDVTLPAEELAVGTLHPITQIRRQVEDAFLGLGYHVRYDREVETTEYNFDKLAFPPWHPTRTPRGSFFLNGEVLLRTETSPSQIHELEEREPPLYMVSIGRCYRPDTIDATHYPIFHQFEGLAVDRGLTLADLKGTLLHVMRALYGEERRVRFRTHYFPFTRAESATAPAAGRASGRAGSRWAGPGWWIRSSSRPAASTRRSGRGSRSAVASSAWRSCATTFLTSGCSGRTTSAC
jgi:phenylalanyl-tRNA synthetase alpha chain